MPVRRDSLAEHRRTSYMLMAEPTRALRESRQGPVALAIAKLEEEQQRAVRAALEQRAAEFATGDGYELPGLSINVVAY